ncbi:hypothetical protein BT96DRAFT_1001493 [Gymnopus androsaceus JB14]|uniref:Uncharacterized protein n=1 Tax=Gymnopus androsaceus JB14 TaxID=1447944 RepID=A0A6A4H1N6_9AGAR|nr:hypothetical protein BT96DRAFT_1001493 [Gymnopus androsaceus JB14]
MVPFSDNQRPSMSKSGCGAAGLGVSTTKPASVGLHNQLALSTIAISEDQKELYEEHIWFLHVVILQGLPAIFDLMAPTLMAYRAKYNVKKLPVWAATFSLRLQELCKKVFEADPLIRCAFIGEERPLQLYNAIFTPRKFLEAKFLNFIQFKISYSETLLEVPQGHHFPQKILYKTRWMVTIPPENQPYAFHRYPTDSSRFNPTNDPLDNNHCFRDITPPLVKAPTGDSSPPMRLFNDDAGSDMEFVGQAPPSLGKLHPSLFMGPRGLEPTPINPRFAYSTTNTKSPGFDGFPKLEGGRVNTSLLHYNSIFTRGGAGPEKRVVVPQTTTSQLCCKLFQKPKTHHAEGSSPARPFITLKDYPDHRIQLQKQADAIEVLAKVKCALSILHPTCEQALVYLHYPASLKVTSQTEYQELYKTLLDLVAPVHQQQKLNLLKKPQFSKKDGSSWRSIREDEGVVEVPAPPKVASTSATPICTRPRAHVATAPNSHHWRESPSPSSSCPNSTAGVEARKGKRTRLNDNASNFRRPKTSGENIFHSLIEAIVQTGNAPLIEDVTPQMVGPWDCEIPETIGYFAAGGAEVPYKVIAYEQFFVFYGYRGSFTQFLAFTGNFSFTIQWLSKWYISSLNRASHNCFLDRELPFSPAPAINLSYPSDWIPSHEFCPFCEEASVQCLWYRTSSFHEVTGQFLSYGDLCDAGYTDFPFPQHLQQIQELCASLENNFPQSDRCNCHSGELMESFLDYSWVCNVLVSYPSQPTAQTLELVVDLPGPNSPLLVTHQFYPTIHCPDHVEVFYDPATWKYYNSRSSYPFTSPALLDEVRPSVKPVLHHPKLHPVQPSNFQPDEFSQRMAKTLSANKESWPNFQEWKFAREVYINWSDPQKVVDIFDSRQFPCLYQHGRIFFGGEAAFALLQTCPPFKVHHPPLLIKKLTSLLGSQSCLPLLSVRPMYQQLSPGDEVLITEIASHFNSTVVRADLAEVQDKHLKQALNSLEGYLELNPSVEDIQYGLLNCYRLDFIYCRGMAKHFHDEAKHSLQLFIGQHKSMMKKGYPLPQIDLDRLPKFIKSLVQLTDAMETDGN